MESVWCLAVRRIVAFEAVFLVVVDVAVVVAVALSVLSGSVVV